MDEMKQHPDLWRVALKAPGRFPTSVHKRYFSLIDSGDFARAEEYLIELFAKLEQQDPRQFDLRGANKMPPWSHATLTGPAVTVTPGPPFNGPITIPPTVNVIITPGNNRIAGG
jgi:hypothetical protein